MGDITIYRTGTILEVVKHTAIAAGAAKSVAENAANDDEQNTFVKVTLSGKDFAKTVEISYAMERMSIDALEQYLVTEISNGLGDAMAADVVSTIGTGISSENKITSSKTGEIAFKDVAAAFGQLKRVGGVAVYGTRATIYKHLVGMVDTNGVPVFQANVQQGAEGSILGALIKVEDAVADGKLLIGDPRKVLYNMIQDILVERDRDIKTHKVIHSGYARGEGVLIDDKAFVELTVKTA
jgi:HK97 family phage major capsid protein